ncbi:hypothetical protein HYPSUDRAFT_217461 [Hypholoma sublateritium FD-334 SS-4]|uniref:BTB domain-containing protein n=1 Tax=Hypholoma sublateritium (strain FD-334 SS-4) TaxID=945553 RepID=A0A0D2NT26_HYPSF|nr:hypothetical protein HYPSUDRAFT_217461 [Hypholoma sublateritium FD-334 SS-4]
MSQGPPTHSDLGLDYAEPEETQVKRCEELWFDDGNVVLQVGHAQFRVHKSILSRQSTVFRDMFALPQPNDTSDWVDGCPVIIMSGDRAEDWEMVLSTFVYRVTTMSTTSLIVPKVAAMVHLGRKYEFGRLYQEVVDLFIVKFPNYLLAYDNNTENFEIWVIRNIAGILAIAEEAGLWSVLPVVYYMALTCQRFKDDLGIFSPSLNIPAHHLRCLINGRIKLCRAVVEYKFNWAAELWESDGSPPPICTKAESCHKVRSKIVKKAFDQLGYGIRQALGKWTETVDDSHALCEKCRRYGRRQFENGREKIWSQLGFFFFDDDWEDMIDQDTDILPTGWRT